MYEISLNTTLLKWKQCDCFLFVVEPIMYYVKSQSVSCCISVHISNCVFVFQDSGRIGDEFMRQIESIAAYVPYMTCPGNHEWA